MIRINSNKTIINMILLYVITLFFYGIIVKFTIWNPTLFKVKTYIPEIILILCTFFSIITNKIRINYKMLLLFSYTVFIIIINYVFNGANVQSFYWWRDLFIPLFSSMILLQRDFQPEDIDYLFKKLAFIAKIFLIFGLVLAIIEQIKGDVWTSKFYTGYTFYGQDPYSKVKVAHNMGLLRAPSLTGNFSSFAHYSCFSLFILLGVNYKHLKVNLLWSLVALFCCILSTNKSAIITLIVVLLMFVTSSLRVSNKHFNRLIFLVIFGLIALMLFSTSDSLFNVESKFTGGLVQRFQIWGNMFSDLDWIQIVFPYKTFLYGTGGEGYNSFFDNTYLYCFITQGLAGSLIWISYLNMIYSNLKYNYLNYKFEFIRNVFYYFLIVSLTSNVVQGHAYFCFMIVIFSILYKFNSMAISGHRLLHN